MVSALLITSEKSWRTRFVAPAGWPGILKRRALDLQHSPVRVACLLVSLVLMAAGLSGCSGGGPTNEGAEPASEIPREAVFALGRIEPATERRNVAPPFGATGARIDRLLISEGEALVAGQVIAELDSLPQLRGQAASAEAEFRASEAAVVQARQNATAGYREAVANRDRAASVLAQATLDRHRQRDLFARALIARARLDDAEATLLQAEKLLDAAEAQVLLRAGGEQQADLQLALRRRDVAEAQWRKAEAEVERGVVRAPMAGTVITLHAREGEVPGSEGVATLGDLRQMHVELEVYQTDIDRVRLGQPVTVQGAALSSPLGGEVATIGLEVERQSVLENDPAARADGRIVRVKAKLDESSSQRAARLTGLEVTGRIQTTPDPS
jgi:HlyD family secretion protein